MFLFLVTKISILNAQQWWTQFVGSGEDEHATRILNYFLDELHLIDGFDTGLHERGALGVKPK